MAALTHTQLDEPLSAHPHPLGEETGELHPVFCILPVP